MHFKFTALGEMGLRTEPASRPDVALGGPSYKPLETVGALEMHCISTDKLRRNNHKIYCHQNLYPCYIHTTVPPRLVFIHT